MIDPHPSNDLPADALPSVVTARTRAQSYWDADGIPSIILGACFAIMGTGGFVAHNARSFEFLGDLARLLGVLILAEESILGKIATWAKSRTTFPRTGYIASPAVTQAQADWAGTVETGQGLRGLILFFMLFGLFSLGIITDRRWPFAVSTAGLIAALWYTRKPGELLSPQSIAYVVYGCILTLLPLGMKLRLDISLLTLGVLLILFGGTTFIRYLRRHSFPHR
jgi:hypothetical protein